MAISLQSFGTPRIDGSYYGGFNDKELDAIAPFVQSPSLLGYCEWKAQRRLPYLRGLIERFIDQKTFDLSALAIG